MTFEIEIRGRMRQVSVDASGPVRPDGGTFRVAIDGTACEVDARQTELGLSLALGDHTIIDVATTDRDAGTWLVQFPHIALTAVVDGRRFRRAGDAGETGTGEQRILAPMPGRVVRLLVTVGDEVDAGQGLVVVEAMKMENELKAARAGRVRDVAIAEGASVEAGRLLLIVE